MVAHTARDGRLDGTADRPLRADDAPGRARRRDRPPPVGVRAVPATAARGPPVRRGGRRRPGAGRDRAVPLRRRRRSRVLREGRVVDEETLAWLADYRFTGDVWGYAEGEVYFPYSPLVVVESTFAEAVLLETLLLSIYNHDSAIASAASRMTRAAGGRPCIEMGSRRTHEEAAVAAPGRRTSPGSRPPPTWPPGSATASRPPAPAPTASRCSTTPRRTRSARR